MYLYRADMVLESGVFNLLLSDWQKINCHVSYVSFGMYVHTHTHYAMQVINKLKKNNELLCVMAMFLFSVLPVTKI